MSEQRLIDAYAMNANAVPVHSGMSEYEMKKEFQKYINHQPTIDTETLTIVRELQKENDNLKANAMILEMAISSNHNSEDMHLITKLMLEKSELREKLARYEKAEQEGRLVEIPSPSDTGISDPLEPMKIGFALKSEMTKLMYRKENNPSSISQLDYTIIAALEATLKERATE